MKKKSVARNTKNKRGENDDERFNSAVAGTGDGVAREQFDGDSAGDGAMRKRVGTSDGEPAEGTKESRMSYISYPSSDKKEIKAMMEKMLRDLCTTAEAAEILGVKDRQIRVLISTNKISAVYLKNLGWVVYKPSLGKYSKTKSHRGRPPSGTASKIST